MLVAKSLRSGNTLAVACTRMLSTTASSAMPVRWTTEPMWPKNFQDPVKTKEEIKELRKSGEFVHKLVAPVKAAESDATCSVFYDAGYVRFRNTLMRKGKKELTDRLMMECFDEIKRIQLAKWRKASQEKKAEIERDPIKILNKAVENATPLLGLNDVKVGAVIYKVPTPLTESRQTFDAISWIIRAAQDRETDGNAPKVRLAKKLARVLVDTADYTGGIIALKHEHHRLCYANRAYANYRTTF